MNTKVSSPLPADQGVVAFAANEHVLALAAVEQVVTVASKQGVAAAVSVQQIVPRRVRPASRPSSVPAMISDACPRPTSSTARVTYLTGDNVARYFDLESRQSD